MKICHVALIDYPGQGSTDIFEYTQNLAKLGYDISIIVPRRKNEKKEEIVDNVHVYRIAIHGRKKNIITSMIFFKKSAKLLGKITKKINFRIVHVYQNVDFGTFLLPIIVKNKNIRWILDFRTGVTSSRFKASVFKIVSRFESNFFDHIIFLDKYLANAILGKHKRVSMVPIGANFDLFKPKSNNLRRKYRIERKDIVIIYTGSLSPLRKLDTIIYAFEKACKKYKNLKLIFVGGGEDLNNLKKVTKRLNLKNRIMFTGRIKYSNVPGYLSISNIGISYVPINSLYDFQPPLKTIEYMACSLPTIATATQGNKRFIKNNFNGVLVKDDIDQVARAIETLINDKKLYEKIKRNSRDSVKTYDYRCIIRKNLIPIYQRLLNDLS